MKLGFEEALNNEQAKRQNRRFRDNQGPREFPWVNLGPAFEDGEYLVRFVNHPEKCPEGWHLYATHACEIDPGRDPKKVLCTQSYAPTQPCYLCELLDLCDDDTIWGELGDDIQDVLRLVKAKRFFLFPVIIKAHKFSSTNDGPNWAPAAQEATMLLSIPQEGVLNRLATLRRRYPNMADWVQGQSVYFTKRGRNYELDMAEGGATPLSPQAQVWVTSVYPKVKEYGFKDKKLSYDRVEAMVKGTWWGQKLGALIEL